MAISEQVRARVRAQAQNRCGYCRSLQMYILGILEIDHIIPPAIGGIVRFLVLDCRSFVVKVDRAYRLCCGPGDFRLTRGH